ncbi:MAG: maltose/maltodextrin ABC transporter substrate-binding protein MalE, partial [Verrucomicrobia bacterium]|nr:maltose/maltodextrin ABC transporter substrate-binding protein MalE [Verrucomicrobiota bacterium]
LGVPALLSYYEQASAKNPLVRDLREAVDKGSIMPNIPQMGRFFSAVGTALQHATYGQLSPEAALKEAANTMRGK